MSETARERRARSVRARIVALAYRQYATLLVEHERVRRAGWNLERSAAWQPAPAAWGTMRFLASVHDSARHGTRVLTAFFGRYGVGEIGDGGKGEESKTSTSRSTSTNGTEAEGSTREESRTTTRTIGGKAEEASESAEAGPAASDGLSGPGFLHPENRTPNTENREGTREAGEAGATLATGAAPSIAPAVPLGAWRDALEAGIDLVADVLVAHEAELPWGRGKPRAPRKREDFEAACRSLRDRDTKEDDLPSIALILDSAGLAAAAPRRIKSDHRVVFYRGRQALLIDGVHIPLPYGLEFEFLEILAERRLHGEVTPRTEHAIDWKNAMDRLRYRIRKATGVHLLSAVVRSVRGVAGGYHMATGVRVRED